MGWSNLVGIEGLEQRVLLSGGGSTARPPAPDVTGDAAAQRVRPMVASTLTTADRQELLAAWTGSNKSALQSALNTSNAAFDNALLDHMRTRAGTYFFFKPGDVAGLIDFMKTYKKPGFINPFFNTEIGQVTADADGYVTRVNAGTVTNSQRARGEFMYELALAYRLTGQAAYRDALTQALDDWARPPAGDPAGWASDGRWTTIDAGMRASNWAWAYMLALGTASTGGLSAAENSLFLHRLYQHGRYLHAAAPRETTSNWRIFHGNGLVELAALLPELAGSGAWAARGEEVLFVAFDRQIYADGMHNEQSPGYLGLVLEEMLETYRLDQILGQTARWTVKRRTRLAAAVEAFYQFLELNADGITATTPAISDTYRTTSVPRLTRAALILDDARYPLNRVKLQDVMLVGSAKVKSVLDTNPTLNLGNRGEDFALASSGNYVARSGNGATDRQVIFDAGPQGGFHGHLDLLNFELWGYGKPLIPDPGVYTYDDSADRAWAISTPAHNTVSVGGVSHGSLEGIGHPGIIVDEYSPGGSATVITAHHHAYQYLPGRPMVGRSVWYDKDGTMLVVDWGESAVPQTFASGFLLPDATPAQLPGGNGYRTNNGGGDVLVQRVGTAPTVLNFAAFHTDDTQADLKADARQIRFRQSGTFVVLATVVRAFNGAPPTVTASFVSPPQPGQPVQIQLDKGDGSGMQTITFEPPEWERLSDSAGPRAIAADVEIDAAGTAHVAWHDPDTRTLKYATRSSAGIWSIAETVDNTPYAGEFLSVELDSQGRPGIAYYDGTNGDLKVARLVSTQWELATADSSGTTGKFPSLRFYPGSDRLFISYYRQTSGDLKLAESIGSSLQNGFRIRTIDTSGDVGRNSSLVLDTSQPFTTFSVAYEDSTNRFLKFATRRQDGSWGRVVVDGTGVATGGSISLAMSPARNPGISYYDETNTNLMYAWRSGGSTWNRQTVQTSQSQGMASVLLFDSSSRANIFYRNRTADAVMRARRSSATSTTWGRTTLFNGAGTVIAADRGPVVGYFILARRTADGRLEAATIA